MRVAVLVLLCLSACARPVLRSLPILKGCSGWAELPITVSVDMEAAEYEPDVRRAISAWNRATGRIMFAWVADLNEAEALVVIGHDLGHLWGRAPGLCASGRRVRVELAAAMDTMQATTAAVHELGHVLGLGHSQNWESIMYPTPNAQLMGDWDLEPKFGQRILPTDAYLAVRLHE